MTECGLQGSSLTKEVPGMTYLGGVTLKKAAPKTGKLTLEAFKQACLLKIKNDQRKQKLSV